MAVPFPGTNIRYPKREEQREFMTRAEIERQVADGATATQLLPFLYLTATETDALLDHARDHGTCPWVYPLVCLVAHTGVRRNEVLRAERADVNLAAGVVTLRERKRKKGMRSTRKVPLSPRLAEVLREWLAAHPGGPALFANPGTRPTPATRDELVHHFGATLAGGTFAVVRGLHVLRHSFISACASRAVDQRLIDEWVGHQTEEQRRRYRHLYPDVQRTAIQSVFGGPSAPNEAGPATPPTEST